MQPRLVKSPKMLISDAGLLCRLLRLDRRRLADDPTALGLALETYVGMELVKQAGIVPGTAVMHYRTSKGTEVDFIVESSDGRLAGIEVKAAASVDERDFRRFDRLQEGLGDRFARGIVLYAGEQVLPFGEGRAAWPVTLL
jgi:predicted AAA+ superfamily ATPase